MSDFSLLVGNDGTKSHFFYNQFGKFSENVQYELNLQDVEGDNYLKNHKLSESSSLIDDDGLLLSNLDINWKFENSYLNTSFKIFEDLSKVTMTDINIYFQILVLQRILIFRKVITERLILAHTAIINILKQTKLKQL